MSSLNSTQAWRQGRLDLAKLMLAKFNTIGDEADPYLAEELAHLLLEIGKGLAKSSCEVDAIPWLEAAQNTIVEYSPDALSTNATDLRLSITHSIVKCQIALGDESHRTKAWNLVHGLTFEFGDRLLVLLLKLDLLASDATPSAEEYRATLSNITRIIHLTDININTALHHIHKLKGWDPGMAQSVLATFLTGRLIGTRNDVWIEKALVTITWICTSSSLSEPLAVICRVYDEVLAQYREPISPSATHAAQILLWKRVETAYAQEAYDTAEAWCHQMLHEMFDRSGGMNIGKVQRKLILCALAQSSEAKARKVVESMSVANRDSPSTQYLLYKVALRWRDPELAAQCLDTICVTSKKDATLIYACVLEAQRMGDSSQTVACIQRVLEKFDYNAPDGVHLPALLRCNARLLIRELDSEQSSHQDIPDQLCKLFEGAAAQAKRSRRQEKDNLFSQVELDWFSRNVYNLALKVCTIWSPPQTHRLVQSCLQIMELYPTDLDAETKADLSLRRLFCDFLSCSLSIATARETDSVQGQLQQYISVRKSVNDWRMHIQTQLARLEGGAKADLQTKHTSLLAYDFEAAACLKAWDALSPIITECAQYGTPKLYAILADITLSAEAPAETTIKTLQHIINITWSSSSDAQDICKLSRWIRCLVSLALASDIEATVESLLEQVLIIIEQTASSPSHPLRTANHNDDNDIEQHQHQPKNHKPSSSYPPEELEWLATTIFNRSIDFYCMGQDETCRRWAERALKLAHLAEDGGAMHAMLQGKFQALVWEAR